MIYRYEIIAENHAGTLSRIARLLESRNHALLILQSKTLDNELSHISLSIRATPQNAEKIRLLIQKMIDVVEVQVRENAEAV